MKSIVLILLMSLVCAAGHSQSAQEGTAIMRPITQLFTGMNLGDSAMVRQAFTATVSMTSIGKDKEGKQRVNHESSLNQFLKAVGTPHAEAWSEPIWDVKMNVDGNFASVWAQYAFYVGKRLNHCGVDAFHLVKGEDGQWKIFHLADTRNKKEECNVPATVSQMFK